MTEVEGQLPAFLPGDLVPKPPDKVWYCTRCGSERVVGVSGLDARERYALAAYCAGCRKKGVMVQRVTLPPKPKPVASP